MAKFCAVRGCFPPKTTEFISIPYKYEIRKKWTELLGLEVQGCRSNVCTRHFAPEALFRRYDKLYVKRGFFPLPVETKASATTLGDQNAAHPEAASPQREEVTSLSEIPSQQGADAVPYTHLDGGQKTSIQESVIAHDDEETLQCVACPSTSNTPNVFFVAPPKNEQMRLEWAAALNLLYLFPEHKICSNHFKPESFSFRDGRIIKNKDCRPIEKRKLTVPEHAMKKAEDHCPLYNVHVRFIKCAFPECPLTSQHCGVYMVSPPENNDGIEEWLPLKRSKELRSAKLCSKHFHPKDLFISGNGIVKCKKGCIPLDSPLMHCAVESCYVTSRCSDITMVPVPKDSAERNHWRKLLALKKLEQFDVVCSNHFKGDDLQYHGKLRACCRRSREPIPVEQEVDIPESMRDLTVNEVEEFFEEIKSDPDNSNNDEAFGFEPEDRGSYDEWEATEIHDENLKINDHVTETYRKDCILQEHSYAGAKKLKRKKKKAIKIGTKQFHVFADEIFVCRAQGCYSTADHETCLRSWFRTPKEDGSHENWLIFRSETELPKNAMVCDKHVHSAFAEARSDQIILKCPTPKLRKSVPLRVGGDIQKKVTVLSPSEAVVTKPKACCVKNCPNTSTNNPQVSWHTTPGEPDSLSGEQWSNLLEMVDMPRGADICSVHFPGRYLKLDANGVVLLDPEALPYCGGYSVNHEEEDESTCEATSSGVVKLQAEVGEITEIKKSTISSDEGILQEEVRRDKTHNYSCPRKCCVKGCLNIRMESKELTWHSTPKNSACNGLLIKAYKELLKFDVPANSLICSHHFPPSAIKVLSDGIPKLKKNALPWPGGMPPALENAHLYLEPPELQNLNVCCVKNCPNTASNNREVSWHSTPLPTSKDLILYQEVLEDERLPGEVRICSAHYPEDCFKTMGDGTRVLRSGALPWHGPCRESVHTWHRLHRYRRNTSNCRVKNCLNTFDTPNITWHYVPKKGTVLFEIFKKVLKDDSIFGSDDICSAHFPPNSFRLDPTGKKIYLKRHALPWPRGYPPGSKYAASESTDIRSYVESYAVEDGELEQSINMFDHHLTDAEGSPTNSPELREISSASPCKRKNLTDDPNKHSAKRKVLRPMNVTQTSYSRYDILTDGEIRICSR